MKVTIATLSAALLMLALALPCEARKRSQTYVDSNGVKRSAKTGKVYRDYKALNDFKRKNPRPNDGRAYDVDHIKPLSKGGADKPKNMRWITVEEHRRKTAAENRGSQ